LRVESLSHDCLIGEDRLHTVTSPVLVDDQRAAGLRFGDRRVHALMQRSVSSHSPPLGFAIGNSVITLRNSKLEIRRPIRRDR
jgi:hypothetical protein